LSFWFMYTGDSPTDSPALLDFKGSSSSRIIFSKWRSTTDASFRINDDDDVDDDVLVIPNGFLCNEWAHYAIVVTRTPTQSVKIYKNRLNVNTYKVAATATTYEGVTAAAEQTYVYPVAQFTTNYIAKSNTASFPYFSGTVDTLGVFPWPVTQEQAQALYDETSRQEMVMIANGCHIMLASSRYFSESCFSPLTLCVGVQPFPFKAPCPSDSSAVEGSAVCSVSACLDVHAALDYVRMHWFGLGCNRLLCMYLTCS